MLISDGLIQIDVALPTSKVAFSLDDRDCFSSNIPGQALGTKVLEWHLLSLMQWQASLDAQQ